MNKALFLHVAAQVVQLRKTLDCSMIIEASPAKYFRNTTHIGADVRVSLLNSTHCVMIYKGPLMLCV